MLWLVGGTTSAHGDQTWLQSFEIQHFSSNHPLLRVWEVLHLENMVKIIQRRWPKCIFDAKPDFPTMHEWSLSATKTTLSDYLNHQSWPSSCRPHKPITACLLSGSRVQFMFLWGVASRRGTYLHLQQPITTADRVGQLGSLQLRAEPD